MIPADTILQSIASGVFDGAAYALYALGLALVFGVLRVINLAHGELVVLGGYASYWLLVGAGIDPLLSIPLAALASGAAAIGAWRAFLRRVRPSGELETLAVTYGLGVFLANLFLQAFTADLRSVDSGWMRTRVAMGGISAGAGEVAAFLLALSAVAALAFFLARTEAGRIVRAVAEDREAAALVGVDAGRVELLAFGLGGALAGLSGPLLGALAHLSPAAGSAVTIKSFILAVLAGLGSIPGVLAAGIVLGVGEALTVTFASSSWREFFGFGLFLGVLSIRPRGLFGRGT